MHYGADLPHNKSSEGSNSESLNQNGFEIQRRRTLT